MRHLTHLRNENVADVKKRYIEFISFCAEYTLNSLYVYLPNGTVGWKREKSESDRSSKAKNTTITHCVLVSQI